MDKELTDDEVIKICDKIISDEYTKLMAKHQATVESQSIDLNTTEGKMKAIGVIEGGLVQEQNKLNE